MPTDCVIQDRGEYKRRTRLDKIPKTVKEGFLKKHPGTKSVETEKVILLDGEKEKVTYELKIKADNKTLEVVIDEEGKVIK